MIIYYLFVTIFIWRIIGGGYLEDVNGQEEGTICCIHRDHVRSSPHIPRQLVEGVGTMIEIDRLILNGCNMKGT